MYALLKMSSLACPRALRVHACARSYFSNVGVDQYLANRAASLRVRAGLPPARHVAVVLQGTRSPSFPIGATVVLDTAGGCDASQVSQDDAAAVVRSHALARCVSLTGCQLCRWWSSVRHCFVSYHRCAKCVQPATQASQTSASCLGWQTEARSRACEALTQLPFALT